MIYTYACGGRAPSGPAEKTHGAPSLLAAFEEKGGEEQEQKWAGSGEE